MNDTGARISASLNLRIQDYYKKDYGKKVQGNIIQGKGGKDREFFMSKNLHTDLNNYLRKRKAPSNPNDFVFLTKKGN